MLNSSTHLAMDLNLCGFMKLPIRENIDACMAVFFFRANLIYLICTKMYFVT